VTAQTTAEQTLGSLARGDAPVLEQLAVMTLDTLERSQLDLQTYLLVRLAALVAMDAAPASYLLALESAGELGVAPEEIQGTLVAIAPVVGTARVVAAAGNMIRSLGLGAELEADGAAQ
jgi:alkylhydroperoxidase/carboxymuconolactone decarboxylase family protein YurZ